MIYILLGLFPLLTFLPRLSTHFSIEKTRNAFLCGISVTTAQIAAGASGAILDIFYIKSKLNRYQVMATKAFTQTLGHGLKLIYYFSLLDWSNGQPDLKLELVPWISACAILGTYAGKQILDKMNEENFRKWSKIIILLIGLVMLTQGIANI